MRARDLLGPRGPLARGLPGYEDREGQLAMADAVERALGEERPLLCEAGTGTGKTLAYLVPAILSGKKVVVSTATKALEEQIFHKDLPLVAERLGLDAQAALMKGLGNYLCLRRFHELRASPSSLTDPVIGRSLPIIEAWAEDTETGDVGELSGLAESDPVWREVASSSDTRLGASCQHFEKCFVTKMRQRTEGARLIVVNHHLFFADLALKSSQPAHARAGALPPYDAVIFDEAHQLEDIATSFFGARVSRAKLEAMIRDAERSFVAGGLAFFTRAKRGERALGPARGATATGEGTALLALVGEAGDDLFQRVAALVPGSAEGRAPLPRDAWHGELLAAYHRLDSVLEALAGYAEANAVNEAVRLVATRAALLRDDLGRVVDPATNQITWVEARARSVVLGASPIEIGRVFRDEVVDRVGAVVLTSATLTTGANGDFRFLRSRLGLEAEDVDVDEVTVPSPFAFESSALLYTPSDLPDVADPSFLGRAADRIAELVAVSRGGAFVLCTSVRSMRALALALRGRTPEPPLLQGDAPKSALVARFRASGKAVLVATMSFWEGVDVPGDALRLVVIDKIPFAVPSDPIVVARQAAIEAAGGNAFVRHSVPQAAITLKQGFGRLLRTRADRGVVAILDRRVRTRSYGATLLGSLPPAPRTERIDDVRKFFQSVNEPVAEPS